MTGISGLILPACTRRRALGAVAALGSRGQAPPCQLGLPPAAAGVAMVTEQASPPSPLLSDQALLEGPQLLGVMETVSRHP